MTRPLFDTAKRAVLWLLTGLTMLSGYGLTKLEPLGPAHYLPMTSLDHAIPLVPWSIWFYGTASWAALIAFLQAPTRLDCRRLWLAVAIAAVCCWWVFFLFPTTYPRELFPLPEGDSWTLANFRDLRGRDTPSNCFPSQHVALAWSLGLTWASFQKNRWMSGLVVLWACLVTIGTVTTKQHYLWDLPPGFVIGVFGFLVAKYGITDSLPFWARKESVIELAREADRQTIRGILARVLARRWTLDDIPWPAPSAPPLHPELVRLLNHVIYIEEIAGLNFRLLSRSTPDDDLRRLYGEFADDERRHADGLRRLIALNGGALERPGLGNAIVLDQFDTLDAALDADAVLVACANPVFETFLDAGTIPFLKNLPELRGPAFDALVERIDADESAHLATNWLVTRAMARRYAGWAGLRLLFNANVWRGSLAVGPMALDVYVLAWRHGFDFRTLLPAFARLWRLHERYPELARFPLWWIFRLFVACGATASLVVIGLERIGLVGGWFWVRWSRLTDRVAWLIFGRKLLDRRGLLAV